MPEFEGVEDEEEDYNLEEGEGGEGRQGGEGGEL